MWKVTLLSLVALLSTVHGYYPSNSRLGVASWDRMLARLMVDEPETGVCGEKCFITLKGETKVFEIDVAVNAGDDPCVVYVCTPSGVVRQDITCQRPKPEDCEGRPPIIYPGKCCPQCEGEPEEPGVFTEWMERTQCSTTCGLGRRARRRECRIREDAAEVICTGRILQTQNCTQGPCPVPCKWEYGEFERCSATCGPAERSRFPIITQQPQHGGEPCPGFVLNRVPDTESCNLRECPVDCEWEYGDYEDCSATCGVGIRRRFPIITVQPQHNGRRCPGFVIDGIPDTDECNLRSCPENCRWEYGPFEGCSVSCGGGVKHQFPIITDHPINGGKPCSPNVLNRVPNSMECNTQPCPVDCEWKYEEFGQCSSTCGRGTKSRFPVITVHPQHNGKPCPRFVIDGTPDKEACDSGSCPVDCEWEYSEFGECSVTCGGGVKYRRPVITVHPAHRGRACPGFVTEGQPDSEECNTQKCPITCDPGENGCIIDGVLTCIPDPDKDCIPTPQDNCAEVYNPNQEDMEHDGVGDICDNCPKYPNPNQMNHDNDETGDACDGDDDQDGIVDQFDNCQFVANADQKNIDRDRFGDACDNCPSKRNDNQADIDEDDVGNACDNCRFFPNSGQDPGDPARLGSKCTTRPPSAMGMEYDYEDELDMESEKKNLAAQIMEKLLEMYYSN